MGSEMCIRDRISGGQEERAAAVRVSPCSVRGEYSSLHYSPDTRTLSQQPGQLRVAGSVFTPGTDRRFLRHDLDTPRTDDRFPLQDLDISFKSDILLICAI